MNCKDVSCIFAVFTAAILPWLYDGTYFPGYPRRSNGKTIREVKKCQLLIAVLSARNHVDQRNAIRRTWFPQNYHFNSTFCVELQFVVGRHSCSLPPEDRIDIFDCKARYINLTDVGSDTTVHFSSSALSLNEEENQNGHIHKEERQFSSMYIGLRFKVLHPVLITKLGISNSVISLNETATVILQSTVTQEEIAKVHLSPRRTGKVVNGYHYRSIETVMLPKGYEGTVILSELISNNDASIKPGDTLHDDSGGLLHFYQVINEEGIGHPFLPHYSVAVSFGYSIYNFQALNAHIANQKTRQDEWNSQLKIENSTLCEEMQQHNDITLVDVTDVYRNLPLKLLAFYQLAVTEYNFEFLLKTDDDSMLHVEKIAHQLQSVSPNWNEKMTWWGRFRYNWLVERYGKWQEIHYRPLVYPPFACGAAYVLSSNVVHWLAQNWRQLHIYQGEDVSLGIWLSAIGPDYIQDKQWQCDDGCQEGALSRGQLTSNEMTRCWTLLKECGNFCNC